MRFLKQLMQRLDRYQQRRRWLAFPFAVVKKFGDDQAGQLAALIAYYGFFSLFPLMLVLVAVLGIVLEGNSGLQQDILDSALAQFPIIGDQIQENVGSLKGSGVALGLGIGGALWAGLGVIKTMQFAMNTVWNVPMKERPSLLMKTLRSLVMLLVLGLFVVAAAGLASLATVRGLPVLIPVASTAGSLILYVTVFLVAFKVLTVANVSVRVVLPGAVVAGVAWFGLQTGGSYIVANQLRDASQVYGFFAVVIGLLTWIYIGAQMTLLAAEINVVKARRLWPRSLSGDLTPTEQEALERLAKVEERRSDERVDVRFEDGDDAQRQAHVEVGDETERQASAGDRSRETR